MAFTATPLDGSATPIPMPTVVPDGTNSPIVVEGGPAIFSGGNNLAPVATQDIERVGYIALTSPPATTNAGTDTPLTFSSQVQRVIIQNNTSANLNYAFDVAATLGSLVLVPGSTLIYPKKVTVVHILTAAAKNINGATAGNIVVLGAI